MPRGTIRTLVSDRGFGFILPEGEPGGAKDLFFHRTDLEGEARFEQLWVGQAVESEMGPDERRGTPRATRVWPVP